MLQAVRVPNFGEDIADLLYKLREVIITINITFVLMLCYAIM